MPDLSSDFIDRVTASRTHLRVLRIAADACGFMTVGQDVADALRALGRISTAYPAVADAGLSPRELLAGLRAARNELEALILADHDPQTTIDIASATLSIARAVVMLARDIVRDERIEATVRALHTGNYPARAEAVGQ